MTLGQSLEIVAPYYNLAFVVIVVILFIKLFSLKNNKLYVHPWHLLFIALLIYIIEEVMVILNMSGALSTPRILYAFFEFMIITIFIYMLLEQKDFLEKKNVK